MYIYCRDDRGCTFFFTFFHLKFGFLKLFNYICLVRLFERITKKKLKKSHKNLDFSKNNVIFEM